jgi:hypothetical protein
MKRFASVARCVLGLVALWLLPSAASASGSDVGALAREVIETAM